METAVANQDELANTNIGPDEVGHSVYVTEDDAWYTAQFQGRGIDKWAAGTPGDPDTALEDLAGAINPGVARNTYVTPVRIALPGDGVPVAIPGPAAGFLRYLSQAHANTDTATAASIGTKLQPQDMIVWKPFAVAQFANPVAGSLLFGGAGGALVLGEGESYELTNANGSGAAHVLYSYIDLPVGNVTLVRTTFGLTPVDIIPAAPAGFFRRFLWVGLVQGAGYTGVTRPAILIDNVDTAAALVHAYIGANIVGNASSANANGSPVLPINADVGITTEALRLATRVAITTSNLNVFAAYETLPMEG